MKTNLFDQKIKQTLEQSPLPLPDHAWARLQKQLHQHEQLQHHRRRWVQWAVAATVAVLLGWGSWYELLSKHEVPAAVGVSTTTAVTHAPSTTASAVQKLGTVLNPLPSHKVKAQPTVATAQPRPAHQPDIVTAPAKAIGLAVEDSEVQSATHGAVSAASADYLSLLDGVKPQPHPVQIAPDQLYETVNSERQREYRESVFGRMYKKYQTVREAVAQRNQQE